MLSEEALERLSERLVNRIEELNTFMINKLGEQIVDIGKVMPSQVGELLQSVKYGNDIDEIMNKIAEITDKNVDDIYKIFEEVAKLNQNYAKQFYKYRNINYVPFDQNIALQNQVNSIAKATANEYINISKTFAYMQYNSKGIKKFTSISKIYQEITDKAVLGVVQGRESYQIAMQKVMKELTSNGLKTVDYATGYSRRADSSIRMNIMDGIRKLNRELQEEFGKEFHADGIEISHHKYAAPDHIDTIDGKQFSKEEFERVNNSLTRHVGELNCYHFIYSIVLGISKPLYSKKELEADKQDNINGFEFEGKHYTMYEGTQLQRQIETKIRQYKDRQIGSKAINNYDEVYHCQEKIRQLTQKYNDLHKASGLPTKIDRLRVDGYRKINIKEVNNLSLDIKPKINNKVNKTFVENIKGKDFIPEIEKYESKIFKNKNETAIIIEETGDIYKFDGFSDYVNIDCNYKNAIITHNHPTFEEEIGGSFGKDDFNMLLKHQDIKELRAVDEKYNYIIKTLNPIKESDYDNAYKNAKLIDNDYKHCVMIELKEKGLIYYERRIRKRTE